MKSSASFVAAQPARRGTKLGTREPPNYCPLDLKVSVGFIQSVGRFYQHNGTFFLRLSLGDAVPP